MLQLGVLGPLTVERDGRALAVPAGRARVLLGALIVSPGAVVSMDELVDRLWGEAPPRTAMTALHGHVSRLRKALGDRALQTTPTGYLLAVDPDQIDSGRFRTKVAEAQQQTVSSSRSRLLREALGLWRGQALADFAYEPFVQSEIAALEEMRVTAIEDAIEADLAVGRHSALIGELQGLVRLHPLRERLCGQLMIALYRSGRQAEALTAYRQARARMVNELGVDPGPALRALEAAILRHDPALVAPTPEPERVDARPAVVPRADRADADFVGRDAELERLSATLARVGARGRTALLTVVGEPGVGKSRLASEFAARVGPRGTLLTAQCEPDVEATYAPVHQLLKQVPVETDDPATHLVDDLLEALRGGTSAAAGVIARAAIRLLRSLAAQRPVVVVLEDIHWAQPGLLELIEDVAANAEAAVMLLCLARPEVLDVRPTLASRDVHAEFVQLGPLASASVRQLVLDVAEPGASPGAVDEIVSTAAGNPLFAMQLVAWSGEARASAPSMPPAVRTLLAGRVGGLGPGELAVLQSAAIVGREFSVEAVAALMPTEAASTVERHCKALARRVLVQRTSHGHRFRHDLIHRSTYVAMDPGLRARLHEKHANWLTADGRADLASADELIGYHFEQAHDNLKTLGARGEHARRLGNRAAAHLGAAGRAAFLRADITGAANLLSRALRLPSDGPQRLALLRDAGRPLRASGRTADAIAVFLEAIERASDIGDVVVEWRSRLELAFLRAYTTSGDDGDAEMLRVAEKAVAALTATQDDEGLASAWQMIAFARGSFGDLNRAGIAFRRARRHALRIPSSPYDAGIAWGMAGVLLEGPTPADVAITRCRELLGYRGQIQPGVMFDLAVLLAMRNGVR